MTHLDDDSSVNVLFILELGILRFKVVKPVSGVLKVPPVLVDLLLVVVDITGVLIDIRSVLVAEGLSILDSVLEVCGGKSERFGGDQHVGGLGDLELVVLSAKESLSVLKVLNLVSEVGQSQIGGRGVTSVIVIVVMVIHGLVCDSRGY